MISEDMIGRRVRQLRFERSMTQEVLAQSAGLTTGYLSRIENSPNSPPVSTLIKISRALGVGIDAIFSDEGIATDFTVVRESERQEVAHRGSAFGYSYEPLALHFPNRHMDPYVLTIPAGAGRTEDFSHEGEEMLFVLKGRVIQYIGDHTIEMGEGDCLYFNSGIPHSTISADGGEVNFIAVFYSPNLHEENL